MTNKCEIDFSLAYSGCNTNYYICLYNKNNQEHYNKMFDFINNNKKHGQGLTYVNEPVMKTMVAFEKQTNVICSVIVYRISMSKSGIKFLSIDGSTTDPEHEKKGLSIFLRYFVFDYEIKNGLQKIYSYTISQVSEFILTNKFGFTKLDDTDVNAIKYIYEDAQEYYDTYANVDDITFKNKMNELKEFIRSCNLKLFNSQAGGYELKYKKYKNKYIKAKHGI